MFAKYFLDSGLLQTRNLLSSSHHSESFTVSLISSNNTEYLYHKWYLYFPILVSITWSFPHSWIIIGFVTRVARRVPLVVHELPTFPENMGSSPVFSGIRVARSLVFCVVIWWSLFVLLSFYFWALCSRFLNLRILITTLFSSNYTYNYSWWYSMFIHILDLYFRQASLSPKQNVGTIENRDLKTSLRNHWQ